MLKTQFKVVDLFSGCGGMSLGFENAGFNVIAAFDNWKPSIDVYKKNFSHPIHEIDLGDSKSIESISKYNPNMIIGGPPCQDFSHAGKRDEHLGRGKLTISFAKIILDILPRCFVMENVDRAVNTKTYAKAYKMFEKAGYGLTQRVLDASLCQVPQKRKRLFLIGELDGSYDAVGFLLDKRLANESMTIRDYLGDSLGVEHYYRHPRNYCRRGVFSIDEPSPTVRGVNRPVPKGYLGHNGDTIAVTDELRPLTTIERSYLQTFPKTFVFEGTKTNLEQMIGNAVPVKQAEYVAGCVRDYMTKNYKEKPTSLFSICG